MRTERNSAWQTINSKVNTWRQRHTALPGRGPRGLGDGLHVAVLGREHLGGMGGQKQDPWPNPFTHACPRHSQSSGALSWAPTLATPKLHPQILHPTLLVEKEEELRKEREWREGDSISEHDFSNKLLILCFLSPLKVTGWDTSKTNHLI